MKYFRAPQDLFGTPGREADHRGSRARPGGAGVERHKDPFDRLIAAQAVVENLPLVVADPAFREYAQVKVES